jgi:hypothetical protein
MNPASELRRCGLDVIDDTVRLLLAGTTVTVRLQSVEPLVVLDVSIPLPGTGQSDRAISLATMQAGGDTSFDRVSGELRATRRLAAPSLGVLYDDVHNLAKSTVSLGSLLQELAKLESELAPPNDDVSRAMPAPSAPPPRAATAPPPGPAPAKPTPRDEWVYVEVPEPLVTSDGREVGRLQPDHWYRIDASQGEWIKVTDDEDRTGWVPEIRVRRRA